MKIIKQIMKVMQVIKTINILKPNQEGCEKYKNQSNYNSKL